MPQLLKSVEFESTMHKFIVVYMIRSKNAGPFWPAMNILATKNQLKLSSKCWYELVHRNYGFKLHKSSSAEGMHKLNCCVAKRLFSTNHFRSLVHCWGDNNRGVFSSEAPIRDWNFDRRSSSRNLNNNCILKINLSQLCSAQSLWGSLGHFLFYHTESEWNVAALMP